ncbi:hypothetical protein VTN00DRAFT_8719 [Thermoascus crustaceus]|uniref:uncharacterized protein n=1 Tax=Thermoascus crustaceus TaxID=5088 RepID=UPI0037445419
MSAAANLTVVICHGSYHTPAPYMLLVQALKAHGIDAYCPQRPSCDLSKLNIVVVQLLGRLVNEDGKLVLLAAYSSGGWVATEAALPALHTTSRRATGKPGGVIGIFCFGAFVIPVGESVSSFFKPKDGTSVTPPWVEFHKSGLGTITNGPRFLFNDMDEASAQTLPCAYLVLEYDQMLPNEYQEGMVVLQSKKSGRPFTVYSDPTSHSPHFSWTDGLVERLEDFAGKIST